MEAAGSTELWSHGSVNRHSAYMLMSPREAQQVKARLMLHLILLFA